MPVSTSVAVLRRRVAIALRQHRENAGLTQKEAGRRTGIAANRLNHFEGMRSLPPDAELVRLLELYEATEETVELLTILPLARKRTPSEAASADPDQFNLYIGLEAGATQIESYDALVLMGLVQTAEYAEAFLRGAVQRFPEAEVRRRLRLRLRRQELLTAESPTHLWLVVPQRVLEVPVGGAEVMRGQLAYLLDLAKLPNVELQVIPRDAVAYSALQGAFTMMSFPIPGDAGLVYVETRVRGLFFEQPDELQEYRQVMNHLRVLAEPPKESRRLIDRIRKEIR
ncbi:transcriptional regulator with XRE-family HTH domain [Kibdelosporangium banguiense]|uniref:Transcriptional regulator with XRE-family HTH domain n=1 Tax=Kibdelosporangium banguiense TaxID=1365924 RepID=A0ABS4T8D4_9PSEU|nr:helix-turn-helix transcriptional regulator [Kibdelosporangium banguiense]MBP2320360.1 transcriptional regulator with XRE-family HTH domain [Kibdelosporangium banguiense]